MRELPIPVFRVSIPNFLLTRRNFKLVRITCFDSFIRMDQLTLSE